MALHSLRRSSARLLMPLAPLLIRLLSRVTFAVMAVVLCVRPPSSASSILPAIVSARVASAAATRDGLSRRKWAPEPAHGKKREPVGPIKAVETSDSEDEDDDDAPFEVRGAFALELLSARGKGVSNGSSSPLVLASSRFARGPGQPRAPPLG